MTELTQKIIYDEIEDIESDIRTGLYANATPRALVLLCRIFMEYIQLEMDQHGQA